MKEDERYTAEVLGAGGLVHDRQPSPDTDIAKAEAAERADNPGRVQPPPAVTVAAHPGAHTSNSSERAAEKQEPRSKARWPERAQAVCAVLLVLITAYYAHYAHVQAIASIDATDAARRAADAAKSAADTASAQLREMRAAGRSSDKQFATQLDRIDKSTREAARNADASNRTADASNRLAGTSQAALRQASRTADASNRLATSSNRLAISSEAGVKESQKGRAQAQLALDASNANFLKDQRPYVFIIVQTVQANSTKDRIVATATVANYGRSPSLRTEANLSAILGNNLGERIEAYFESPMLPIERVAC